MTFDLSLIISSFSTVRDKHVPCGFLPTLQQVIKRYSTRHRKLCRHADLQDRKRTENAWSRLQNYSVKTAEENTIKL